MIKTPSIKLKNTMVQLRPFETNDQTELTKLANNINIWNGLRDTLPHPYTKNDAKEYIERCQSFNPVRNFVIEYNGQFAGSAGIIPQEDIYRKTAEIGYWIGEPFWGKGIATKAIQLIVKYGFENFDIVKLYACTFATNIGSQKALEKNGFEKEAVLKRAVIKNEVILDEIRFARFR